LDTWEDNTMTATRQKLGMMLLLAAGLTGVGAAADKPVGDDSGLSARVDRQVQAWQPTRDERRLDTIGWAGDLRDALRLAKESARPIFLFTYSGSSERENAMALQRC
jgi:hypothetical protein